MPDPLNHTRSRFFASLLCFAFCLGAQAEEPQNTNADAQDFVIATLPYPVEEVHDRILTLFDSDARDFYDDYNSKIYALPDDARDIKSLPPKAYDAFMAFPIVRPNKFYVFYAAYSTRQHLIRDLDVVAAMGHSNAALQRYAHLPAEARVFDVYLWSPDTPFWYSEYGDDDRQLPFRSYFIIHLTAVDESHSTIEIIEDQPMVKVANRPVVDAHGVVHRFDIREVEPTTSDRIYLISCIKQFIERKVPGRHWFSCKTDAELAEPPPVPFTVP